MTTCELLEPPSSSTASDRLKPHTAPHTTPSKNTMDRSHQSNRSSPSASAASPSRNHSVSPVRSLKTTPSSSPKLPPPIPIPHLLLDRSRLKPVPKPSPAPLQPPVAFSHLPFRSKLRSVTSPAAPGKSAVPTPPASTPPVPSRSVSGGLISTQASLESSSPDVAPEPKLATPVESSLDPDQSTTTITDTSSVAPPSPTVVLDISSDQSNQNTSPTVVLDIPSDPSNQNTSPTVILDIPSVQSNQNNSDTINPSAVADTGSISTVQMDVDQSHTAIDPMDQSSSKSISPDQSLPSSTQDSPESYIQEPTPIPSQDGHTQSENNQDQIQSWQNEFNLTHGSSAMDHSSLERANSAAARLDSLARLNGVRTPEPFSQIRNRDFLPPFLMAKHIEETKRKVELGQSIMDPTLAGHSLSTYPLPLPVSLGFSVGPNGRGVPRLSALQRKALEKIADQQGSSDLSTATTSLSRSHTTTGTESPKHLVNRIQPSGTGESNERQQARSNLIRKLSSRDPNSRPKRNIQSPPPTQSLSDHRETAETRPLRFTPEHQHIPSTEQLQVRSLSTQDQSALGDPLYLSHSPNSANSFVHSFDLNHVQLSQLGSVSNFALDIDPKVESEQAIRSNLSRILDQSTERPINASIMTGTETDHYAPSAQQSSLDMLDGHRSLYHQQSHASSENDDISTSDVTIPPAARPLSPVHNSQSQAVSNHPPTLASNTASEVPHNSYSPPTHDRFQMPQHQPSVSLTKSHSAASDSSDVYKADLDNRYSANNNQDYPEDSLAAIAITADLPYLAPPSARSSIVSRLKARTSLSSRIDRSLASGRSTSPSQHKSPQSSVTHSSQTTADLRRSVTNGNRRLSRPPPSTTHRLRTAAPEVSEDQASKTSSIINRADSMSPSKPFHHGDRPLRPSRAPPIAQAHNVVGRGLPHHRPGGDLGPSQFPPTPHLVRTHMPVASAVDLARYNNQKLAPFPGLLNLSPPSSPERPRSPRSSSKTPKSANHGILSSASNFFRSPNRRSRDDSTSSEARAGHAGSHKNTETLPPSKYSIAMSSSNGDKQEVVDSSRWQSIGDAAEKITSSGHMSRSSTVDSNNSSSLSMISAQRREQILARLSPFLKSPAASTPHNSKLNDPPRKLLWHQPVLQVANSASFKDRYLFLFNDILVITKPMLEFEDRDGERVPKLPITLKQSFLTKSVVELKNLRILSTSSPTGLDKQGGQLTEGALDFRFKEEFQKDPSCAIQSYLGSVDIQSKAADIARLLLSTYDLDKRQLGQYLSGPEHTKILKNYLDQLNFSFMRLEDAFRSVLLSLRLPADPAAISRFLEQFGIAWSMSNPKICISAAVATRWATALIVLSEQLHDGLTDSMRYVAGFIGSPNKIKTEDDFVEMVRADEKPTAALSSEKLVAMLKKAYQSIRRDRLIQARANAEDTESIQLFAEDGQANGSQLPNQLTYQVASGLISLSIPKPDSQFGIKLFGPGLIFEPAFVSFSNSQTASFRIKGNAIGMRQVSFIKIGRRAAAYEGLPLNAMVSVERAFMKHTVQIGFFNHLSVKRKYLLSFHGSDFKDKFTELVTRAQGEARSKSPQTEGRDGPEPMGKTVALQVLRDTLILNEDLVPMNVNPYASTTVVLTAGNRKAKSSKESSAKESSAAKKSSRIRSNSLSETYIHTMGRLEKDLHQAIVDRRNQAQEMHVRHRQQKLLQEQLKTNLAGGKLALDPYSCSNKENPVGNADEKENLHLISRFTKSGHQLIEHCERNSLIPLVLGFLSMGVEKSGAGQMSNSNSLTNYASQPNLQAARNEGSTSHTFTKQTSHRHLYQ